MFHCSACSLRFTVGWSHFASFDGGYGAITRLVCIKCGTEHAVEIAIRDRGPERFAFYDVQLTRVPDEERVEVMKLLRAHFDMTLSEAKSALDSLPLKIAGRVSGRIADELSSGFGLVADLEVVEVASEPNPAYGPLLPDRLLSCGEPRYGDEGSFEPIAIRGPVRGPNKEFDLDIQTCGYCQAISTLVAGEEQIGSECPHCGDPAIECLESWAT